MKNYTNKTLYFLTILSLAIISCKKESGVSESKDSLVVIKVDISKSTYDEKIILAKNNQEESFDESGDQVIQKQSLDLNDDYYMDSELLLDNSNNVIKDKNIVQKIGNKATLVDKPVPNGTRYKLVIFNSDGSYNKERDYIKGSEANTDTLLLIRGKKYTFITYSVGSTTALPAITFSNNANKTLETASVNLSNVASSNVDFMHYRLDSDIINSETFTINSYFKHSFSQLTVSIDASLTGNNVTTATSNFSTNNNSATVSLANGNVTSRSTPVTPTITFPNTNLSTIVSTPFIINDATNNIGKLNISSITIGDITLADAVIDNLPVTPGQSYTLKIKIKPTDGILDANTVRIGGQVWQRLNIGATSSTPDTYGEALFGNYYQWGYDEHNRTGTYTNGAIPWDGTGRTAPILWNGNPSTSVTTRENSPSRGTSDPCPSGYRIPTNMEFRTLISNTTVENRTFLAGSYDTGMRLVSKRNKNAKITFPAQGAGNQNGTSIPATHRGLDNHGIRCFLWTSYTTPNIVSEFESSATTLSVTLSNQFRVVYLRNTPIRCIQGN